MENSRKINVLIVDDEPDLCESFSYILEDLGFETQSSNTASQAFHCIMNSPIDIVLSDVRMPGESGVDLIRRVRLQRPNSPVFILMTGFSDTSPKDALAAGAEEMLFKPVKLEYLQNLLEKIRQRLLNQQAS